MLKLLCFALAIILPLREFAQQTGNKVTVTAADGRVFNGTIKTVFQGKFLVSYDGYNFEAWLTKDQFQLQNDRVAIAKPANSSSANKANKSDVEWLNDIYRFGEQQGWTSPRFRTQFSNYIQSLSAADQRRLLMFLRQATTSSARFFAVKSLITGDSYEVVQQFITELNQQPEAYQQENCMVTSQRSIIQQWQYSCSVTTLQTFLADLSPRYAWEVKRIPNYDVAVNNAACPMAIQQKQLLEKYGGIATPRGDVSGVAIGITTGLNELVGPVLGVTFYAQQVTENIATVLQKVRSQIDQGIDMPLLVGFSGTQSRHFILAMRYRNSNNGRQYLIYDPWDGKCEYIDESAILRGSLAPLLPQWTISIDYYYPIR